MDAISAEDIGKFPDSNVAASLQRVPGVSIQRSGTRGEPTGITVRGFGGEDLALMFEWFNSSGYDADIAALRKIHPGLMDFKTWLKKTDWTI